MNEAFQAAVELATRGLAGDAELRDEVRTELESHLEASADAWRAAGREPREAERLACEAFGDPEQIGPRLAAANFRRMKLRARIRLAVKVLFLPALLLALWAGISLRDLTALRWLRVFTEQSAMRVPSPSLGEQWADPALAAIQGGDREAARRAYDDHRLDPVCRAAWLLEEFRRRSEDSVAERAGLTAELETARRLEPDNALFDYLLAALNFDRAAAVTRPKDAPTTLEVLDRELLDRAMAHVRSGVLKPYCETYIAEALRRKLGPPDEHADMLTALNRVEIAAQTWLPQLSAIRQFGYALPAYGILLYREGQTADAEFYCNAVAPYILQYNETVFTLIEELALRGVAASAQRTLEAFVLETGRPDLAEAIGEYYAAAAAAWAAFDDARRNDRNSLTLAEHGGFLAGLLYPPVTETLTADFLRPELQLSYNLLDSALLTATLVFWSVLLLIGMAWELLFRSRNCYLILPPWRDCLKFLLAGILAPLALYWLISRFDPIGGRDWSLRFNLWRYLVQCLVPALGIPLWSAWIYRRTIRKFFRRTGRGRPDPALLGLNARVARLAALLVIGVCLGTLLRLEQRYYAAQDQAPGRVTSGFTAPEKRMIERLKSDCRRVFRELPAEALPLK